MLIITRTNLEISSNTTMIPYQGSKNIPVKVEYEDDDYSDYIIQPKVSYYDGSKTQETLLAYEDGMFHLPAQVFEVSGIKKIALGLIKEEVEYVTNAIQIIVNAAPNGTVILPVETEWNELVEAYMKQVFDKNYKPTYDEYITEYNDLLVEMNEKLSNALDQQEDFKNNLESILLKNLTDTSESIDNMKEDIKAELIEELGDLTSQNIQSVSLESLSLNNTSDLEVICSTMNNYTKITYQINSSDYSQYPISNGIVEIIRISSYRVTIRVSSVASSMSIPPRIWTNSWRTDYGLIGWVELATRNNVFATGITDLDAIDGLGAYYTSVNPNSYPTGLGGNACLVFHTGSQTSSYSVQLAFGFGSDKIAMRRKNGSTTWTSWAYTSLSGTS